MSLEDMSFEQRDELAALARTLSENPSTRKDFLRLTKKVKPDLIVPELEIEDKTQSYIEKLEKRLEEREAKERERDAQSELDRRRQTLVQKGIAKTDDEIQEIEKVMLEKSIANHETAAEYWQWMKQSAAPTPTGYQSNALNKFDLSQFWKNPVAGARNEAMKALNELRKNPKPIGL
jgi:hypothetical protein